MFGLGAASSTPSQQPNVSTVAYEDTMSTSPDNSPQPKDRANSTAFVFPTPPTQSSAGGISNGQGLGSSLFDRISQPTADETAPPAPGQDSPEVNSHDSLAQNEPIHSETTQSPFFGLPQVPAQVPARSPEPSPTRSSKNVEWSNLHKPTLDNTRSATNELFGNFKVPDVTPTAQTNSRVTHSALDFPGTPPPPDAHGFQANDKHDSLTLKTQPGLEVSYWKIALTELFRAPPECPADFTEEERRQLLIGYQLKTLDAGVRLFLGKNPRFNAQSERITRFYGQIKHAILEQRDILTSPVQSPTVGHKRKSMDDQDDREVPGKKARIDTSPSTPSRQQSQVLGGDLFSQTSTPKPLLAEPAPTQQAMNGKRKAQENPSGSTSEGTATGSKRARIDGSVSYPSLSSSPSSQTSNIFKKILENKEPNYLPSAVKVNMPKSDQSIQQAQVEQPLIPKSGNGNHQPLFPVAPGSVGGSLKKNDGGLFTQPNSKAGATFTPFQPPPPTSTSSSLFSTKPSTSSSLFPTKPSTNSSLFSGEPSTGSSLFSGKPSTSSSSSPLFSSEPPTSSQTSSGKPSTASSLFSDKPSTSSSLFSSNPSSSSSLTTEKPTTSSTQRRGKPSVTATTPSLVPPKFGTPVDFLSQFGKAAKETAEQEKAIRKEDDFDPDEDDEAEWERKYAEEQKAKKGKLEETLKGRTAKFIPGQGFSLVSPNPKKEDPKTSSPPELVSRSDQSSVPKEPGVSVLTRPLKLANGDNIFGHLSDAESGAEGSKTGDADDEDTESEANDDRSVDNPVTEGTITGRSISPSKVLANSNPFDPSMFSTGKNAGQSTKLDDQSKPTGGLFNRISKDENGNAIREIPPSTEKNTQSQPTGGLFDRISKDENGNAIRETPPSTEKKTFDFIKSASSQSTNEGSAPQSGIFGSSLFGKPSSSVSGANLFGQASPFGGPPKSQAPPNTPNSSIFRQPSTTSPTSPLGTKNSPGTDNTWKVDTPIKFGSSGSPPGVKITSPSPSKPALGGLFGSAESTAKSGSDLLGATPTKAETIGFGFGFGGPPKPAVDSLAPPSNVGSNATSRATSPGVITGGESANESNADGDDETEKQMQLDLAAGGPGEEDEEILFAVKAKAMSYDAGTKTWLSKGVGILRVLKHRETAKNRILMRQAPSGKIVLNAALLSTMKYEYLKPKSVKMAVATDGGKLSTWMIRVGNDDDAVELAKILEKEKHN